MSLGTKTAANFNKLLTTTSLKYVPEHFIADKVLTRETHFQFTGYIGTYGKSHLRVERDLVGGKIEYSRVTSNTTDRLAFIISKHGLSDVITEEDFANTDQPFEARLDTTNDLQTKILLGREIGLSTALTTVANFNGGANAVTLTGTQQYNDYENSTPGADFKVARDTIKKATGRPPHKAVMSWEVFQCLKDHPEIINRFYQVEKALAGATVAQVAEFMNVKELLIGEESYDPSKEGQDGDLQPCWNRDIVFMVAPATGKKIITLGYSIYLKGDRPDGVRVFQNPIDNPPNAEEILVDKTYTDLIVNDGKAGYLIKNAVAEV